MCESKVVVFVSLVGMSREKLLMVSRPREAWRGERRPENRQSRECQICPSQKRNPGFLYVATFYVINLTFSQS
jgi:hypothetical protein